MKHPQKNNLGSPKFFGILGVNQKPLFGTLKLKAVHIVI